MSDEKKIDENALNQRNQNRMEDSDVLQCTENDSLQICKEDVRLNLKEAASDPSDQISVNDLEKLKAENAALKDQVMRIAAEMENLRRRTVRDMADVKNYSIANFARDMLSVSDNLARALIALPEGARDSDPRLKALAEGVEMTERAMMSALQRYGVQKIEPYGQKFDPYFHQAMFEISDTDAPTNTVQQVVQPGYVIGERVLRPAMVGITKGGPRNEDHSHEFPDETRKEDEN